MNNFFKIVVTLFLVFIITPLLAQTVPQSIAQVPPSITQSETNQEIARMKKEFEILDKQVNSQNNISENAFNRISNQIDSASLHVDIMMGLFTVLAVILGIYVTGVERSVKKIKEDTQSLLTESTKIRDETQKINKDIYNDFRKIYEKIKEEETIDLLNRLVAVPEDILNLFPILASRNLSSDTHFSLLQEAYLKYSNNPPHNYNDEYPLLILQHFHNRLFSNEFCTKIFREHFVRRSENFFPIELTRLIDSFATGVENKNFEEIKSDIKIMVEGILSRQIADTSTLHPDLNYLFSKLTERGIQVTDLCSIRTNVQIDQYTDKFERFCDEFKKLNNPKNPNL